MLRTVSQASGQCCRRLLIPATDSLQQVRGTVVVERIHKPKPTEDGELPVLLHKHHMYRLVERVHGTPTPPITVILTATVHGVGTAGQEVTVPRKVFRGNLFPAGLAVYASPENREKFSRLHKPEESAERDSVGSKWAGLTLKQLSGLHLRVPMSGDNSWILSRQNVRVALRKSGIEAKEHCIELPREPITGPSTEPTQFKFRITMNGKDWTMATGHIVLRHNDPSKDTPVDLPRMWTPSQPHPPPHGVDPPHSSTHTDTGAARELTDQ